MKDALTNYTYDFLQKCVSMYKQNGIKIQDAISKIQKSENDLKKTRNELQQVFLLRKASDVFVKRKISETELPERTESKIIVPNASFIPGEIQDFEFKGSLENTQINLYTGEHKNKPLHRRRTQK